jgi:hypothetical protein
MKIKSRKIILFEMNEVPYKVIDHYVEKFPNSTLAKILTSSKQLNTVCEDQIELDPWISWPTLHRGVIDQQHQILHLGQSLEFANVNYPSVWELLAQQNVSVGIFGSLHSSSAPPSLSNYKFYVPDFFSNEVFAYPNDLESFQKFNLIMTRRSGRNVDSQIPLSSTLPFLLRYLKSGINLDTIKTTIDVLLNEFFNPHLKCRRRSIQPLIGMDIFSDLMYQFQPGFSTFYTNHVAAAMHRFWAAAFPNDVEDNPMPLDWRQKYSSEIEFTMHVLDKLLQNIKRFVDTHNDYILMIASSMGQYAIRAETTPGYTTIGNLDLFMKSMGLSSDEWQQRFAMVPCISVIVEASKSDDFEQKLQSLSVGSDRMQRSQKEIAPLSYDRKEDNSFQIFVYFEGEQSLTQANIRDSSSAFDEIGFNYFQHQDQICCSGRHTPFGSLIIYDPTKSIPTSQSQSTSRSTISTLDIVPAILQNFGLGIPNYMNTPDPTLLDVTRSDRKTLVTVSGGGVEQTVTRTSSTF